MEQHDHDPTTDDPWSEAGRRWSGLGDGLRQRYRELVGDEGPSEDDIRAALHTLGEAARTVGESIGTAMRDPEVRSQLREAAASLVSALGTTFDELGDELRHTFRDETSAAGSDQEE